MLTLKVLAFSCVLAIGPSVMWAQDVVEIKSGDFTIKCRAADGVKANPDFLALYQTIVAGLKSAFEGNQIAPAKNVEVRGDILKSSSSGKILNGVMMYVGNTGAEAATLRGNFFPCKDSAMSAQEYQEKIYADYFKALTEKIKTIN